MPATTQPDVDEPSNESSDTPDVPTDPPAEPETSPADEPPVDVDPPADEPSVPAE